MPGAWELNKPSLVTLAIPFKGNVSMHFAISLRGLDLPEYTNILTMNHYNIDIARNLLIEEILKIQPNSKYILFLDSDMIVPKDGVRKLLDRKVDVISGLYYSKQINGKAIAAWIFDKEKNAYVPIDNKQNSEIVQVDTVGLGFCLIKTELFTKIQRPWFKYTHGEYDPMGEPLQQNTLSEDFYFFRKLEKIGIKPLVDMTVKCEHIGNCIIKDGNLELIK